MYSLKLELIYVNCESLRIDRLCYFEGLVGEQFSVTIS